MTAMPDLLELAMAAAREAGARLAVQVPTAVRDWDKDIKLDADANAHAYIVESLKGSGIPVLSEEGESRTVAAPLMWVIDPLDGSLNFFRGMPMCAVSIALVKDGAPILGVVYDFLRDELFAGEVGKGATQNGKTIQVSSVADKGGAVLMTGFPSHTDYSSEALEQSVQFVQHFKKVRLIGSAALSLAYVAAGRADAYFEKDIYAWDVAAGAALVLAAGGTVDGFAPNAEGTCTLWASNGHIVR